MLGLDLDGDPQGRPDNEFGQRFAALATQVGADLQASTDLQSPPGRPSR
jgi:hypothetical protein